MLSPPLAQLCAWYSWMHRDQASLAINPLTRCLFTSREKEASTPVIIPSHHIIFPSLEAPRINILLLHLLSTNMHASLPLLQTVEYGHPIISHPTLRPSRVCHSSHPHRLHRWYPPPALVSRISTCTRPSPWWCSRDVSLLSITYPQLPVSEEFSITKSYLCRLLLLIK
jgi:hypothetical protein